MERFLKLLHHETKKLDFLFKKVRNLILTLVELLDHLFFNIGPTEVNDASMERFSQNKQCKQLKIGFSS